MWDIKSITDSKYSCEQALMKAYAIYLSRDYQMILADSWGFNYSYHYRTIGEKISPGYRGSRNENYELFHGIQIINTAISSFNELNLFVKNKFCSSPVMIDYDTFYCPWSKLYKKRHIFHRLLIIDILGKNKYLCLDHYVQEPVKLDFVEYDDWKGNASSFIIKPNNKTQINRSDYYNQLQTHCKYLVETNMLTSLKNFLVDMNSKTDISNEIEPYKNLDESPLLININRVKNQRLCFKEYLEYLLTIGVLENHFFDYIELFDKMSDKYHSLKMTIAKEIVQNKPRDKSKLLEEIFTLESKALEKLFKLCL